jgi:thiamine pyrophosphate-dependent acetolactate synthase large subunit-like protein
MGGAALVGLGLAVAQPQQPVLVLTGDGEMLMGLGSQATVVLDNECYGQTGQQRTHTAMGGDLAAIASACGMRNTAPCGTATSSPPSATTCTHVRILSSRS